MCGCFVHETLELPDLLLVFSFDVPRQEFLAVGEREHEFVSGRNGWICDGFVLKLDCVGKAFAFGVLDVTVVDTVVLR